MMPPQRNFKRKSSGKFSRNFESSAEETRADNKLTDGESENTTSALSVKCDNKKDGLIIPNRVFVGGISFSTTEWDIRARFAAYGNIKAVKILRDINGISRGYGFVTFETENQVRSILEEGEIILKGRKVNVAPAIKKQSYQSVRSLSSTEMKLTSTVEKFSGLYIYEQGTSNKRFEEQTCKFNYNLTLEYSGNEVGEAQLPMENTLTSMDSRMNFSEPNMQFHDYGNTQMNYLSFPAWVYIPEQNYPGSSIGYPMNSNVLEMVQVVPAPLCLLNSELK